MRDNIIEIIGLSKSFGDKPALDDITISVKRGSITGLIGKSGAGKSTLLRCINLLEQPTRGAVNISGKDILAFDDCEIKKLRGSIGMIFQSFNLLSNKTVEENIGLPLEFIGVSKAEIQNKVKSIALMVGISQKLKEYPNNLSGGQQQRVAIARALVSDPPILLCDEFTSALDPHTTTEILNLLKSINKHLGVTIVLITHDMSVVQQICDYVYVLDHGRVIEKGSIVDILSKPKHKR